MREASTDSPNERVLVQLFPKAGSRAPAWRALFWEKSAQKTPSMRGAGGASPPESIEETRGNLRFPLISLYFSDPLPFYGLFWPQPKAGPFSLCSACASMGQASGKNSREAEAPLQLSSDSASFITAARRMEGCRLRVAMTVRSAWSSVAALGERHWIAPTMTDVSNFRLVRR